MRPPERQGYLDRGIVAGSSDTIAGEGEGSEGARMDRTDRMAGGCSCGSVRYSLSEPPREVLVCHCRDCRRATGAQSVAWLIQPLRSIEFTRGTPASRESSPEVTRVFCRGCGTQIGYRNRTADSVAVTLASLDDPSAFRPTRTTFEEQRLAWASPM
jgi:hypothetical protein